MEFHNGKTEMIRIANQINLTPFYWVFSLDYSVHVDRKILKRFYQLL
jgi:hypothetical protein